MDEQFVTVRMIRTARGSPDGLRLQQYIAGTDYDIPRVLAEQFYEMNVAQPAMETPEKRHGRNNS